MPFIKLEHTEERNSMDGSKLSLGNFELEILRYPLQTTTRSLAKCALVWLTAFSVMVFLPVVHTSMVVIPTT